MFVDSSGEQARPYSEVRLLRDATTLYVGGYAADEDIESTDFFQFSIGSLLFRVDPRGYYNSSEVGIDAAGEYDGTFDDPSNNDEEWLIEASVPLSLIGLTPESPVAMLASRCDVTKDTVLRCGSYAATLEIPSSSTR